MVFETLDEKILADRDAPASDLVDDAPVVAPVLAPPVDYYAQYIQQQIDDGINIHRRSSSPDTQRFR